MKLLAVPNGAVFIIFFPLWKFFPMSLRANANFQIQQSPWDLTRANLQLDLTIWSRTLPPPPTPPHLVHLRIAPIRLSIKIIMLQRKYKNDIRMQECHRRNIRFDFEFKSTLLHLSAWILAALFGVQYLWNIGSYNALYNFPPKWNQSIFSI